ncbi:hypothetical protein N8K70_13325 [Microbacterium betulae]|uniref:Uncharacterized protein n=1 Tax=Microbacterium betulae TaxID=2981139 RepID=A0AA97FG23_9MICO|nr:hypothetical protein [Microbacterium sp. AB]WOF22360.1 hypothetical protein N8K70_13325 [Microbacterium sp. AB]
MMAFITSMRHPDNADDYAYNETLLSATLASLEQQTSDDYIVIIVGNRAPSFPLPQRTRFVEVDFEPPARVNGPHADRSGFVKDKGTKIGAGLLAAREHEPDWVMIFDADDFVHRDLVAFVETRPGSDGWVIDRGWIYSRSRNGYRRQEAFNRTCGTSYIIPFDAYNVPPDLSIHSTQEALLAAYGDVLPNIMGAHRNAETWHRAHGRTLRSLPFRGAVYHVDTGENHSGKALAGVIRPLDAQLTTDFAITSDRPRPSTIFACLGPKSIGESIWMLVKRLLGPAYRAVRRGTHGTAARHDG